MNRQFTISRGHSEDVVAEDHMSRLIHFVRFEVWTSETHVNVAVSTT
jgi:hypothetical protein